MVRDRPDEPQLPLYSLAVSGDVAGLLFAQVRTGAMAFKGVVENEDMIDGVRAWNRLQQTRDSGSWFEVLYGWRIAMEAWERLFAKGRPPWIQNSTRTLAGTANWGPYAASMNPWPGRRGPGLASRVTSALGRIADHRARARALDSGRSFIVQAPAGSGKTELLMQRFLVLLAGVESPEEIVAITFTRKAAAEMRQRILQALESARTDEAPEGEHEHHIWTLARKALERDAECGWQLLDHPARLRIQTIDSLCAALARQMPMLSQFGAVPEIAENAQPLYLEAARNTLFDLESDAEWSDSIAVLMQHLDNRLDRLQDLICVMLGGRDRWLRHIARTDDPKLQRSRLEAAMAERITMVLAELVQLFPAARGAELARLARFAASHLPAKTTSAIACCKTLQYLPGSRLKHRDSWEGIAELLLTQAGQWRKSLTKRQGFPPKSSGRGAKEKDELEDAKACMESLLHSLDEHDDLREKLCVLQALPSHRYEERDWEVLQALVQVLRVASAHWRLCSVNGDRWISRPWCWLQSGRSGSRKPRRTWRWPWITGSSTCWWTSSRHLVQPVRVAGTTHGWLAVQ